MTQTPDARKAKALAKARARSQANQQVTKAARKLKKADRNARRGRDDALVRRRAAESGLVIADRVERTAVRDSARISQEAAAFEREVGKS